MANGKASEDLEEFVLRSGPRSGLKREFAFALKVHSEGYGSIGRTRSKNIQSPSHGEVSPSCSNKKIRTSLAGDDTAGDSKKNDERINFCGAADIMIGESSKKGVIRGPHFNGVSFDLDNERIKTDCDALLEIRKKSDESPKFSAPNGVSVDMVNEKIETSETSCSGGEVSEELNKGGNFREFVANEEDCATEASMGIEDKKATCQDSSIDNVTETCIALDEKKSNVEEESQIANGDCELKIPISFSGGMEKTVEDNDVKAEDDNLLKTSPLIFPKRNFRSGTYKNVVGNDGKVWDDCNMPLLSPKGIIATLKSEMEEVDSENGDVAAGNKIEFGGEGMIEVTGEKVTNENAEGTVDGNTGMAAGGDEKMMADGDVSKPSPPPSPESRSSQSIVINTMNGDAEKNLESNDDNMLDQDEKKAIDSNLSMPLPYYPPPPRRVTRSLTKSSRDPLSSTASSVDDCSTVCEAELKPIMSKSIVENDTKAANEISPSSGSSKKLELKMSKKIALTKIPSNIKDLLATGLLEGLRVQYMRTKKAVLYGTVMGEGILCCCSYCNERKVVLPAEFERHAGSLNKHPSMYIHFENGKSFRDVLNLCKRAPLDMLESTIRDVLGISSIDEDAVNHIRKEPSPLRVLEPEMIRDKCPASDQSQEESPPSGIDESPASLTSSSRIQKLCLRTRPPDNTSKQLLSQKKNIYGRLTRKDLRLHKLVFMDDILPDGTEVAYYASGKKFLEGYIKGNSIFCFCCNNEVSPSQFEAHAGWSSRRKPYLHIYTSNGVSLHELSVSLSKDRKFSSYENDDLCTICADGGDLLCCDGCPRAFHKDCVDLPTVPCGDWYCKYCVTMFEKEKFVASNVNALAAGRVPGVDPIEQITKRCIRIVKTSEAEYTACVLCRSHDFSKSGFGPRTVLLCDQCEREYHVGCLKDYNMGDLKDLPEGKWFCCGDCNRIHTALQKLVLRGSEVLPASLSTVIRQKHSDKASSSSNNLDVRWKLLSGKVTSSDDRLLLSKAVAIFHDCFDPIVDSATSRDLIPSIVYGRNIRDQEFGGMYCAVLTVNSTVVSAGLLRIFGQEIAELPLVATSRDNQGKGYFQSLFLCIERLLGFLNVKRLLLPAAEEAESIWTQKFNFKKISQDEVMELTRDTHVLTFQGTSMLHKFVPKCRIVCKPAKASLR